MMAQLTRRDVALALLGAAGLGLIAAGIVWLREGFSWTATVTGLTVAVVHLIIVAEYLLDAAHRRAMSPPQAPPPS